MAIKKRAVRDTLIGKFGFVEVALLDKAIAAYERGEADLPPAAPTIHPSSFIPHNFQPRQLVDNLHGFKANRNNLPDQT